MAYVDTHIVPSLLQGLGGRDNLGLDNLTPALRNIGESANDCLQYGILSRTGIQTLIASLSLRSMLSIKPGNTSPA